MPLMVSVEVPAGVLAPVLMVRTDDPVPAMDGGLNVPEAPVGRPVTLKATIPLNPPDGETATEYVAVPPGATIADAGDAESEKSVPNKP